MAYSVFPAPSSGANASDLNRVQILTNSQTWTHPDNPTANSPKWVEVTVVGGGGGGGGGSAHGSNTNTGAGTVCIGAGGGGGGYAHKAFIPITGTVPVTIGAGGTGAAGANRAASNTASDSTPANNGNSGGVTIFGGVVSTGGSGARSSQTTDGLNVSPYLEWQIQNQYSRGGSGGAPGYSSYPYGGSYGSQAGWGTTNIIANGGAYNTNNAGFYKYEYTVSAEQLYASNNAWAYAGWGINTEVFFPGSSSDRTRVKNIPKPESMLQPGGGGAGSAVGTYYTNVTNLSSTNDIGYGGAQLIGTSGDGGYANASATRPNTNTNGNSGGAATYGGGGGGGGSVVVAANTTANATAGTGGNGGNGYVIIRY